MSVYSRYLYQLRQSVAMSLDDNITGQAESGSNTSFVCSSLTRDDGYYNGWDCRFYLGTHKDVSREIQDFYHDSTTVTLAWAVTNSIDTTDYFELHRRFTTSQYNDAINRAIEIGKDEYLLDKKDESTALVNDTYEYAVPSGFRYIAQIYMESVINTGKYLTSDLIDSHKWWVVPVNSTNSVIKFDNNLFGIGTGEAGRDLRIIGQTIQSSLSNDADTCLLPSEFVIQYARALLLAQDKDPQSRIQAELAIKIAENERRRMVIPPSGVPVFEV